jgi:isoquinoline 1-oxidoreductase beta subunit
MPYQIAHQKIAHVIVPTPVPVGFWRSVGHSHNAFFKESFIDELAHAAGADPVDFRRDLLANRKRHLTVLDAAMNKAGKPAEGRAHGVALHQSFGTVVRKLPKCRCRMAKSAYTGGLCGRLRHCVNPNIMRSRWNRQLFSV